MSTGYTIHNPRQCQGGRLLLAFKSEDREDVCVVHYPGRLGRYQVLVNQNLAKEFEGKAGVLNHLFYRYSAIAPIVREIIDGKIPFSDDQTVIV
jgi:hypothetical protein